METTRPAPYDWHPVAQFMPAVNEVVRIRQLCCWAVWTGEKWLAVDRCGNREYLAWVPEFWRREYYPAEPAVC